MDERLELQPLPPEMVGPGAREREVAANLGRERIVRVFYVGKSGEPARYWAAAVVSLGSHERALQHFAMSAELAPYGLWGKRSKDYLELLR